MKRVLTRVFLGTTLVGFLTVNTQQASVNAKRSGYFFASTLLLQSLALLQLLLSFLGMSRSNLRALGKRMISPFLLRLSRRISTSRQRTVVLLVLHHHVLVADDISLRARHLVRHRQRTDFIITPHALLAIFTADVLSLDTGHMTGAARAMLFLAPLLLLSLHLLLLLDTLLELVTDESIHGFLRIGGALLLSLALFHNGTVIVISGASSSFLFHLMSLV